MTEAANAPDPSEIAHDAPSSFQEFPDLCVARIANFLDRSSQVHLAATCRTANRIVSDAALVPKRWPWKPAALLRLEPEPKAVVFSPNGARLALFCPASSGGEGAPGLLQLWDVAMGLLCQQGPPRRGRSGRLPDVDQNGEDCQLVFSPDSEMLLVLGTNDQEEGTVWVATNLSSAGQEDLEVLSVAFHDSLPILSVSFIDNDWISYVVGTEANVMKRKVIREESTGLENQPNGISFSEPECVFEPDPELIPASFVFTEYPHTMCVSSNGPQKSMHVLASTSHTRFYLLDAKTDSMSVGFAPDTVSHTPVFSPNDHVLVVPCSGAGLALFGCGEDVVDDDCTGANLGPAHTLRSNQSDGRSEEYKYLSFLPFSKWKVLATHTWFDRADNSGDCVLRVIDLQNHHILSEGWNETTWQLMVGFHYPSAELEVPPVGLLRVSNNEDEDFTSVRLAIPHYDLERILDEEDDSSRGSEEEENQQESDGSEGM